MIAAKKQPLFTAIFHQLNQRLLTRHFQTIFITKNSLRTRPSHALFILNHSSWWDGLISFHLDRTLFGGKGHFMMHESGIKRFPYFRHLGAFSINRNNPKDIIRALRYGSEKLREGESVWVFPQGDEKHLDLRPLGFLPGFLHMAAHAPDAPLIPISYCYSFGHHKKPELYIHIGQPLYHMREKEYTAHVEQHCTAQLDALKASIVAEADGFIPVKDWRWHA